MEKFNTENRYSTHCLKISQWNGNWCIMGPSTTIIYFAEDKADAIKTLVSWEYADRMFNTLSEIDSDSAVEMLDIINNAVMSWMES